MLKNSRLRTWIVVVMAALPMALTGGAVLVAQESFFWGIGADYLTRRITMDENLAIPALVGGHASLGFSLNKFDLFAEVGLTGSAEGAHPDFSGATPEVSGYQVPFTLNGSYNILSDSAVELRPELFFGGVWTDTNLIVHNQITTQTSDFSVLTGGGVRLSIGLGDLAALYFGAYLDYRFDAEDFSNSDLQASNFQIKGGVTMHPQAVSRQSAPQRNSRPRQAQPGRYSNKSASSASYGPVAPVGMAAYNAPVSDFAATVTGIDGMLLNVLRTGLVVNAPPVGTKAPDSLAMVLRKESGALPASPVPSLTPAPNTVLASAAFPNTSASGNSSASSNSSTSANGTNSANSGAADNASAADNMSASANTAVGTASAPVNTAGSRGTGQDGTVEQIASVSLEQEQQEIASIKAELLRQKEALAAENTPVVRSSRVVSETATGAAVATPAAPTTQTAAAQNVDTVYYGPNETKSPVIYSIPTLDAVGKKLQANKDLMVTIKGYSAPAGTKEGQNDVSEKRAKYCADYIADKYMISRDRIVIEWYGASKRPEETNDYDQSIFERAVELVVSPISKKVAQVSTSR